MAFHGMGGGGMAAYLEEQKKRGRKTDSRTLRRVAQSFSPYKVQVVMVLIAILLTTVLGLVNPLLIQRIFDDAIGKRNLNLLIIFVLIMFITPMPPTISPTLEMTTIAMATPNVIARN